MITKGRLLIHYIDFGDEEWLPKRRIYPLPEQFSTVPGMALRCHLAYMKTKKVEPKTHKDNESGDKEKNENVELGPDQGGKSGEEENIGDVLSNGNRDEGGTSRGMRKSWNEGIVTKKGDKKEIEGEEGEVWCKEAIDRFEAIAGSEKTLDMHIVKGRLSDLRHR